MIIRDEEVMLIDRRQREATLGSGEIVHLTMFFDEQRDEIDNPEVAVYALGPMRSGRWLALDLRRINEPVLH